MRAIFSFFCDFRFFVIKSLCAWIPWISFLPSSVELIRSVDLLREFWFKRLPEMWTLFFDSLYIGSYKLWIQNNIVDVSLNFYFHKCKFICRFTNIISFTATHFFIVYFVTLLNKKYMEVIVDRNDWRKASI